LVLGLVAVLLGIVGANACYLAGVTILEAATGREYQNYFYQYMFLGHLALGLLLIVPLLVFVIVHFRNARPLRNRQAAWFGYALLAALLIPVMTGLLLVQKLPARILLRWVAHVILRSGAPSALWKTCQQARNCVAHKGLRRKARPPCGALSCATRTI